jgi:hypothetical protein
MKWDNKCNLIISVRFKEEFNRNREEYRWKIIIMMKNRIKEIEE